MTPIRYIQLAASPGLSLPGLHPHLQGLPGFPIGSQMVPNGTMDERFMIQTTQFFPSVSDSSVLQQQFLRGVSSGSFFGEFPQSIFSSPASVQCLHVLWLHSLILIPEPIHKLNRMRQGVRGFMHVHSKF